VVAHQSDAAALQPGQERLLAIAAQDIDTLDS
jgi:hypothetical protein